MPKLSFLREQSSANVQGVASLPVTRLERKLGQVPDDTLQKVKRALAFAMELY
jgi:mRNA interferase MazF